MSLNRYVKKLLKKYNIHYQLKKRAVPDHRTETALF